MKAARWLLLLSVSFLLPARADLTIVQKIEGAGSISEMTIKIKGDKARVEASPEVTTIIDSKSGEMLSLLNDKKKFLRISGDKAKAVAEMATRFGGEKQPQEKPKLTPTGKKETIGGYEAEEYSCVAPKFKASYWIAPQYPNSAAIVKQMQAMTPASWSAGITSMPDYRDFPGLPIRTNINMEGKQITSTITAVKQDPLPDAQFSAPADYQEMKMPNIGKMLGGKSEKTRDEPATNSPEPSARP
ncbi:MAG: DUF4412 domain-containing protein [Chthoniobacterales bacterium]